jgi:hypothetical protein
MTMTDTHGNQELGLGQVQTRVNIYRMWCRQISSMANVVLGVKDPVFHTWSGQIKDYKDLVFHTWSDQRL